MVIRGRLTIRLPRTSGAAKRAGASNLFDMRKVIQIGSLSLLGMVPMGIFAQIYDCEIAQVICSDTTFIFEPNGKGKDDFENPNNDNGCLLERERESAWYFFQFRTDMPPNSVIEFTIKPLGGNQIDFDFAIYGPDLNCDSLGSPVRCSFADPNNFASVGDTTGLRPFVIRRNAFGEIIGVTVVRDTWEGRGRDEFGDPADGFVLPMVVQPGEGFYLLLDYFQGDIDLELEDLRFQFTWGGSAAPYLNCIANPRCVDAYADAGPDLEVCAGAPDSRLQGQAFNTNGMESYRWSGTSEALAFLDDPNSPNPRLAIPPDFSGELWYRLDVLEGACVKADSVRVRVNPAPRPTIAGNTEFCPGGSVALRASPGFATYAWANGPTTPNITANQAGTYTVRVTDNNGCVGEASLAVRTLEAPNPIISGPPGFCEGQSIELRVEQAFSSIIWSTGGNGAAIAVNRAGRYSVVATNDAGCQGDAQVDIVAYPRLEVAIEGLDYYCEGGSVVLEANAGFVEYLWNTGQRTARIEARQADRYQVTVRDANGCEAGAEFNVREAPLPRPSIDGEPTFCSGEAISLTATPGFASYLWSNQENERLLRVSLPGTYEVTVTDALGCEGAASFTTDTLPVPRPIISGPFSFCESETIELSVQTGFAFYRWSTGEGTSSITVGRGGPYEVTVRNSEGCAASARVDIQAFPRPELRIQGPEFFCEGQVATLDAGADFSEYAWSSGQRTRRIEVAQGRSYTLEVRDVNGCEARDDITVREIPRPNPDIFGDATFCSGDSTDLVAAPGFVEYRWSTGQRERFLTINMPGVYTLVVTDEFGCQGAIDFLVDTLPVPRPVIGGDLSFCLGDSALISPGPGYATYRWSTGAQTDHLWVFRGGQYGVTVANEFGCIGETRVMVNAFVTRRPNFDQPFRLCSGETITIDPGEFAQYRWPDGSRERTFTVDRGGEYELNVVDANGCPSSSIAEVEEFAVTPPQILGPEAFCSGQEVSFFAQGSYVSYDWSTGATTPNITLRRGGEYTVRVVDANGCASRESKMLTENESPKVAIEGPLSFCHGDSTVLWVAPGYGSYTWTNGRSGSSIVVRQPGAYGVVVRAENGCITRDEVRVSIAPSPSPLVSGPPGICPEGVALLDAGEGYRLYQWSDNSTRQTLEVARPGVFSVTLTDTRGCRGSGQFTLRQLDVPRLSIEGRQFFCTGGSVDLRAGEGFAAYRWSTGDTLSSIEVASSGIYLVTVQDNNGCHASRSIVVTELPAPEATLEGRPYFCEGEAVSLTVSEIYPRYAWSTGEQGRSIRVETSDEYRVTVTSQAGCQVSRAISVEEIPRPAADAGPQQTLNCYRPVIRLGGPLTTLGDRYRYRWSGPGINASNMGMPNPAVSAPGEYLLLVEDTVYGCVSAPSRVDIDDVRYQPQAEVLVEETLDCRRDTVLIDGRNSDFGPQFIYRWLDQEGQPIAQAHSALLQVTQPGRFTLFVVDTITGCAGSAAVSVVANRVAPRLSAGPDKQLDCRRETAILDGRILTPGENIRFSWATEQGNFLYKDNPLMPEVDREGWYFLRARDESNGCERVDSVLVVRDVQAPLANAGREQEIDCDREEVILDASASSAGRDIRLQWSLLDNPALSSQNARWAVREPGEYLLTVINEANGCRAFDTVRVTKNENFPSAAAVTVKPTRCFGTADGAIIIDSVVGGNAPYVFSLDNEVFLSNNVFDGLKASTYELTVQDARGCEYRVPLEVKPGNDLRLYLGEDQIIDLGQSVTIQAYINVPPDQVDAYYWTNPKDLPCDTCQIIKVTPTQQTTYSAAVADINGCTAKDAVTIIVRKEGRIYIPNAFSPNNDGHNDVFMIFSGNDVTRIHYLRIFDRWGEKVFEARDFRPNDPSRGWDGRHRGRFMNPAVFVYVAEVEFIDGSVKLYKGDVTLMR
jgi:gliding motility-associated-like protein